MKIPPVWFSKLHPVIQALVIVCCCCLIAIMLISHDATTNFISILTMAVYFMSKRPKDPNSIDGKEK